MRYSSICSLRRATVCGYVILAAGCGASDITTISHQSDPQRGERLHSNGGVSVYEIPDSRRQLLVAYMKIAVKDPASGRTRFMTTAEAQRQLADDAIVSPVEVTRLVTTEMLRRDKAILGRFPGDRVFADRLAEPAFGNCAPCCPCCYHQNPVTCACECSWGCMKTCYRYEEETNGDIIRLLDSLATIPDSTRIIWP